MSGDIIVETLPNGQKQLVRLKRSKSHHHHHGRHHHHPHLHDFWDPLHHHHDHHHGAVGGGHHHQRHHRRHKSHHHHHSGNKHLENCAHVTVEEWNALVERERELCQDNETLQGQNKKLRDELAATAAANASLKDEVAGARGEVGRLEACVADLTAKAQTLCDDNTALRASLDSATEQLEQRNCQVERQARENEKLARKVGRLERENDGLWARIRQLERDCHHRHPHHAHHHLPNPFTETIEALRRAVHGWKQKCEEAEKRVVDLLDYVDQQKDKITLYERLLRRHHIIH